MNDKYDLNIKVSRTDDFSDRSITELISYLKEAKTKIEELKKSKIELLYSLQKVIDSIDKSATEDEKSIGRLPIESLYDLCLHEKQNDVISSLKKVSVNLLKDREKVFEEFDTICMELKIMELSAIQCRAELILRIL